MISDADVLPLSFFFPDSYLFSWNVQRVIDSFGMQHVSRGQFNAFFE
jgi:hypothetical protein